MSACFYVILIPSNLTSHYQAIYINFLIVSLLSYLSLLVLEYMSQFAES